MKKLLQTKNNVIIIVLCLTIICMSIGFIILSTNKPIEDYSYNVVFKDIVKTGSLKGSDITPISSVKLINNQEISMKYTLYHPNDEISYTAYIENKGDIPCEIVDIMESTSSKELDPVSIKITDVKGKIIPPKEKISIKIVVYYNSTNKPIVTKSFDYKIGLITRSR